MNLFIKKNGIILSTLCLLCLILESSNAYAQKTWDRGAATNNWGDANNWNPNEVPSATDAVTIPNGFSTVSVNVNASCASLTISSGNVPLTVNINLGITLTVGGNVSIESPTDNTSDKTIAVGTGSLICSSLSMSIPTGNDNCILSVSAGTVTVTGNITMNGAANENNINITGAGTLNIGGSITGGDLNSTSAGSIVNYNGSSPQTVAINSDYVYANLHINNTAGVTLQAAVTTSNVTQNIRVQSGTLSNGGFAIAGGSGDVLEVSNGARLLIGGTTSSFPTGFGTVTLGNTSIVEYAGTGAQIVENSVTYGHLTTSGGNTKTLETAGGTMTFNGNITIGSGTTLSSNNKTMNVAGNWINNGTFTQGTSTVVFNGTTAQTIGGSTSTIFNNVTINNTADVTLLNNQTVNGVLTFITGKLETGPYNVIFGTTGSISGEDASKYLVGDLTISRVVGTGTINNLGGAGFSILNTGDNLGTVSVTRISGSAGIITAGGNQGIARKWIITSTNPPSSGRSISFSWVSDDDNGVNLVNALIFRSADGSEPWTPIGIAQNVSSTRTITATTNVFSTWTVADEESPLPVELISFTASLQGKGVILNWTTQTEVQNYGFEVERLQDYSSNGGKRLNDWEKIGFVQGQGNSNAPKEYSFTDNNLLFGKYYYRLKQIGTDGSYEYSSEVEVATGKIPEGFVLEQNYPNPFNPNTSIRFAVNETSPALLKVYDVLGNEVVTLFNETAEAGKYYYLDFDASRYSSGIYYYSLSAGNYRDIKKMMLIK